jgi:hypothetical protein
LLYFSLPDAVFPAAILAARLRRLDIYARTLGHFIIHPSHIDKVFTGIVTAVFTVLKVSS